MADIAQLQIKDILTSPSGFPSGTVIAQYSYALNAPLPVAATSEARWNDVQEMKGDLEQFVADLGERGMLRFLLAAAYLKADGTFNSIASVRGRKVTANVYDPNPLKVQ